MPNLTVDYPIRSEESLVKTLAEDFKPVVIDQSDFEKREKKTNASFWHFRSLQNSTQ